MDPWGWSHLFLQSNMGLNPLLINKARIHVNARVYDPSEAMTGMSNKTKSVEIVVQYNESINKLLHKLNTSWWKKVVFHKHKHINKYEATPTHPPVAEFFSIISTNLSFQTHFFAPYYPDIRAIWEWNMVVSPNSWVEDQSSYGPWTWRHPSKIFLSLLLNSCSNSKVETSHNHF